MGNCGTDSRDDGQNRVQRVVSELPPLRCEPTGELLDFFGEKINTKYIRVSEKVHEILKKYGLYRFKDSAANLLGSDKLPVSYGSNSQAQYHGQVQGEKLHGKGHFVDKDGNLFVAPFANGLANGMGAVYFASGDYFFGELVSNDLESGKMVYANGTVYMGEFRNKQRNGRGAYVYPDGTKYEGDWLNDKEHGNGRLVIEGVWDSGKKVTSIPTTAIARTPDAGINAKANANSHPSPQMNTAKVPPK